MIINIIKKYYIYILILFFVAFSFRTCKKKIKNKKQENLEIQLGKRGIGTKIFLCGIGTSNLGTEEMFSLFNGADLGPATNLVALTVKKGDIIKYRLPENYKVWYCSSNTKKSYTYYDDEGGNKRSNSGFNLNDSFNGWLIIKIHKNCEFKIGILK